MKKGMVVSEVRKGSIADELGLSKGDTILCPERWNFLKLKKMKKRIWG